MKVFGVLIACVLGFGLFGSAVGGLNDGLVAYYPFDGNANDMSGNGNHGTENGGISYYASGKIGQAATLDGVDDYIDIGGGNLIDPNSPFAVTAFVNIPVMGCYPNNHLQSFTVYVQNDDDSGYTVNHLMINPNKGTVGYDNWNPGGSGIESIQNSIPLGEWVFVVWVKENNNVVRIYVNGREVEYELYQPEIPESSSFIDRTLIGGRYSYYSQSEAECAFTGEQPGPHSLFIGQLDDIRIYNRALSHSEIQELYQLRGSGNQVPVAPTLNVSISGNLVIGNWLAQSSVMRYKLYYAPAPYQGPHTIKSIDMGNKTSIGGQFPWGKAFYVAVTAINEYGESEYSNIGYFAIPDQFNPDNADLWIEMDGVVLGVPVSIGAPELYIRDQSGRSVYPDIETAGRLLASGSMISDLQNATFDGLEKTLGEVIAASIVANAVNEVGEFAEKGLTKIAQTTAQSILAPATGGGSAVDFVAGNIADIIDKSVSSLDDAKFAIGLGLVFETKSLIDLYNQKRVDILAQKSRGEVINYDELYSTWKMKKVISQIAPFSAKMALQSVTKGDDKGGFMFRFFHGLVDSFSRITMDTVYGLAGGTVKLVNSSLNAVKSSLDVAIEMEKIAKLIASIYSVGNESYVQFYSDFAKKKGLTSYR